MNEKFVGLNENLTLKNFWIWFGFDDFCGRIEMRTLNDF
jgi:hypothetical protein